MANFIYFLAIGLFSLACQKKHNNTSAQPDIKWAKIVIKGELSVKSFYGDIDKEMIVGTDQSILKTTDGGKTWTKVARDIGMVFEFIVKGDTLFGLAGRPTYYSIDNGDSWQVLEELRIPNRPMQVATSANDLYKFVLNADGENGLPSDVFLSIDNGSSWQNIFPYKHYITGIYVDKADKVYLGVWGDVTWKDWAFFPNGTKEAIIYYTKGR
jgi:hypothetical protein